MAHILFERERVVLEFINQYIKRFGYAPTLKEICQGVGVNSPATVAEHIYKLEDKGFLIRVPGKRRGIQVADKAKKIAEEESTIELPILGFIAAGKPIEPHTDPNAYLSVAASTLNTDKTKTCYILQVRGQSLIEDGIMDGDYVLIQHQSEAKNGDLVVAVLPSGFATLKRIFFENQRIRLQPANREMTPIYTTEVKIQGKVVGLVRKYNGQ